MEKRDFWHEIEKRFWLVARAKSPLCTSYAHETKKAAFAEAERLAKEENDRFFVLECVGYSEVNSVRTIIFDNAVNKEEKCNWKSDMKKPGLYHTDCSKSIYYRFDPEGFPQHCGFCGKKIAFFI